MNTPLNPVALRTQLAARARTQAELAEDLGVPPTTLSGWIRGAHPAPADLIRRIEKALGLAAGALASEALREDEPNRPRTFGEASARVQLEAAGERGRRRARRHSKSS